MSVHSEVTALVQKAQQFIASARLLRQHGDLASAAFGQHFVKAGELPGGMHQWLRSAFDKRQVANYEAQPVLTNADVSMMEKQAGQFLARVQEYLQRQGFL